MDTTSAAIRYQGWIRIIQDCNNSGLSKRDYCQQNQIDEKRFYYYQRRIRAIIAAQNERPTLPGSNPDLATSAVERPQGNHPQIVKIGLTGKAQTNASMISFSVNGMNFAVPEDIPDSFLAKLLEAASHGSR